jgi:hypothetical protein
MRIQSIIRSFIVFLFLIIPLLTVGCSSSSDSSVPGGGATSTAPLDSSVKNVVLASGVPVEIKFTFTVPGDISAKGDAAVNVTESLKNITLSSSPITENSNRFETLRLLAYALVKDAFAATPETAQVTAFVSYPGDPDVCSSSYRFGPYSITGMIGGALSSDTASIELTGPVVDVVNAGSFELCVVTIPPIDAYLTITGVAVDFEPCAEPTVDVVGEWTGVYSCTNFGTGVPDAVDEPINLTISKNADGSYHYEDGVAEYDGHLCEDKFKFTGGDGDYYTESGTFVFSSSTSSTKTSVWNSIPPGLSGGTCVDTLQKTQS